MPPRAPAKRRYGEPPGMTRKRRRQFQKWRGTAYRSDPDLFLGLLLIWAHLKRLGALPDENSGFLIDPLLRALVRHPRASAAAFENIANFDQTEILRTLDLTGQLPKSHRLILYTARARYLAQAAAREADPLAEV